jgi:hypothetical protein
MRNAKLDLKERAAAVQVLLGQMSEDLTRYPDEEASRTEVRKLVQIIVEWNKILQEVL